MALIMGGKSGYAPATAYPTPEAAESAMSCARRAIGDKAGDTVLEIVYVPLKKVVKYEWAEAQSRV